MVPNHAWHVDFYDKLKPYGIATNECIDDFSRNVVLLEANTTNSDPKVIANYYTETLRVAHSASMQIWELKTFTVNKCKCS